MYVQQQTVDESYLASSHVLTPDPRKEFPFSKQRLLVYWDFPRSLFQKKLTLFANILLWNHEKKQISVPIKRKKDFLSIDLPTQDQNLKLLTYQIQVFAENGKCISTWNHHFWTNSIRIEEEK